MNLNVKHNLVTGILKRAYSFTPSEATVASIVEATLSGPIGAIEARHDAVSTILSVTYGDVTDETKNFIFSSIC